MVQYVAEKRQEPGCIIGSRYASPAARILGEGRLREASCVPGRICAEQGKEFFCDSLPCKTVLPVLLETAGALFYRKAALIQADIQRIGVFADKFTAHVRFF